ncbi:HAD superfamily- subfamily IIIB acid phosphatase [Striga hermonthica]|uniref:HAD superfamily- subfamily IIIB acid phosphatase n=1 Tax=Striga hermonthica TaxID=68872 RepID=A0A9N7NAV0_STRHE|nr:HAD superfamily- subfamily IIIB acid phosphatase [Striga hermonthica]
MATDLSFLSLVVICSFLLIGLSSADWNILNQRISKSGLQITLKNYCESWRMNVELHNIRDFEVVPEECVEYIGKYMSSTQYKVDSERTTDECTVYLSTNCGLKKDGADAWIFDIDDTLLSTVPYYKKNGYGGKKLNSTSLEEWMKQGKAPALEHSLRLFNRLKGLGVQIILVSSRRECLRSATIDNLVDVGYHGWKSLILRGADDLKKDVQKYKADVRKQLGKDGYRIWGILGDQWSSIEGLPTAKRSFKLPNPLYYVA